MPEETTPVETTPEVTPAPVPEPVAQAPAQSPSAFNAEEAFRSLERNLLTLATQIQGIQQQAPLPTSDKEPTDQELWSLAQQGNQHAFELYQERIADRRFNKRFGEHQSGQSVQTQLNALVAKYPEFADPNHQITQRAQAFKQALVRMGEPANSPKTDLDAMLRAVADSREIIAPRQPVHAARSAAPQHFAPSHQTQQSAPRPEAVSEADAKLAKQYGVRDAAKAKSRFWERQANGQSSISPTVIAALDVAERQGNAR